MAIDTGLGISKLEQAVVDYYDGSEEFYEREELALLDNETIITGYGYGIRTIVEERLPVEPYQNRNTTVSGGQGEPAMRTVSGVEGIAELPASPVPRRITRDMVLRVISEPGSTTGCSETPDASPGTKASKEPKTSENSVSDKGDVPKKEIVNGNHQAKSSREFRHSIVSQAQTSLMESSTLELAVRYSSPDANGTASGNGTTEDGMSELLEGYQHTEVNSKSEADMMDGPSPAKDVPDKKSIHTIKSSEEQSFKSCTDLPEQSYKDADVKSFKTCQDEMTPDRAASLPASRMPSSSLTNSEARPYRPAPEVPLSSPSTILRKKHAFPIRESSFAKVSRMRANSKLSSRQGSTVTSISSAEGIGQQTPPVPPRESSSSKEAQRSTAVASYLLRGFRSGGRFSGFGSKIRNELSSQAGSSDDVSRSADIQNEVADRPSDSNEGGRSESPWSNTVFPQAQGPVNELKISIKKPESGPARQETVPNMLSGGVVSGNGTLPRSTEMQLATPGHNRSLSTPSAAIIPEPSSVYSSENNSSSYKSRVQSSPAGNSKSPERSRRDSQSTTHLVWPSRKPLHVRSTTTPERARKSSDQDDTTTDLRLSSFRQPHQMHYLPDLKEESHEDSSLNTSASNLKNSSFRFPAGQPSIRESVDDSLLPTRNGSLRSRRNSGQAQARGLPSMNFSRMDLVANLDDFFGPHSIRSLDAHSEETAEAVYGGVTRSATDGAMREKYRSVFGALEGGERVVGADQTAMGLMALKPRYSTRDIMSDIENLDVPSVRNLTERISELFPGLREPSQREEPGEFVEEEQIMEHVMGELQEVAAPAQKRSEARLRPLPGSPQLMVVDDAVYEELTKREKEGANAAAGDETKTCTTTGTPPVKGGQYGESPIAELEAPCVAKLRPRSLSFEDRPSSRHSVRKSQLSLPSTPTASTDTHPWYNDKNFPWATTTIPSIDISLPPRDVLLRSSPRPAGPSPLRSRLSDSSERTMSSPQDGEGSGIAGHLGDSAGEARISGIRRGVHYDIDNNLSPPQFDSSGYLAAPISSRGSAQQTHEAGDRYPTSSLSPPSHTNLPSLSHPAPARLSPDSDDEIAIASPRKRRLSILPRLSISRHAPSSSRTGDQVAPAQQHPELRESAQEQTQDPHQSRRLTFVNARGLTRQEFEMGRFKNKIKSAFRKVGSGFKKLVRREPSIEEIVPVRSPRRAGDREIPLEGKATLYTAQRIPIDISQFKRLRPACRSPTPRSSSPPRRCAARASVASGSSIAAVAPPRRPPPPP